MKHVKVKDKFDMIMLRQQLKSLRIIPGIDGAPRPIAPPPETAACATVVGFDIQPARGVGTGAGVGWKGCKKEGPAPK